MMTSGHRNQSPRLAMFPSIPFPRLAPLPAHTLVLTPGPCTPPLPILPLWVVMLLYYTYTPGSTLFFGKSLS